MVRKSFLRGWKGNLKSFRYWITLPVVAIMVLVTFIVALPFLILGVMNWREIGQGIIETNAELVNMLRGK